MELGGAHPDGGMLIQYNCVKYQCEPDLPDKLADVVSQYPRQVYLAPYPAMDAKIAMAAPGRLEVLDSFDEQKIRVHTKEPEQIKNIGRLEWRA